MILPSLIGRESPDEMRKSCAEIIEDRGENNTRMKLFTLFTLCLTIFVTLFCAPKVNQWQSELLYSIEDLGRDRQSAECSFLLFPVIINNSFDSSTALSPKRLQRILNKYQNSVTVYKQRDFEKKYLSLHSKDSLDIFYTNLIKKDMLSLSGSDSVWSTMSGRYLIIVRLMEGMNIKSFDGLQKRKIVLESELWHTKRREVVWRTQVSGFEMKEKVSDAEFIAQGVEEIFKLIPEFLSVRNEENW